MKIVIDAEVIDTFTGISYVFTGWGTHDFLQLRL